MAKRNYETQDQKKREERFYGQNQKYINIMEILEKLKYEINLLGLEDSELTGVRIRLAELEEEIKKQYNK